MIKKIVRCFKRIIIAGFMLYAFNVIINPLDLQIPINGLTVLVTTIFGVISIPFLVLILLLIF